MSEQQRIGFGNRKLWAGGAVMVLAVGVAMIAFDLPPKSSDVVGTIAPAERYRAPQAGAEAVQLGQPAAGVGTAGAVATDDKTAERATSADRMQSADRVQSADRMQSADRAGMAEKAAKD